MAKYEKREQRILIHNLYCRCDCGHFTHNHLTEVASPNIFSYHFSDGRCKECTCNRFKCKQMGVA